MRDGDYMFTAFGPIRYLVSDGPALKITSNDWSVSFDGTIIALSLEEIDGQKWLNNASDQQLTDLRLVAIPDDIGAGTRATLKRLAKANPNVDLNVESEAALRQVLPDFEPRAVFIADDMPLQLLANQPQLETLMVGASNPAASIFSRPCRSFVVSYWEIGMLRKQVRYRKDFPHWSRLSSLEATWQT